MYNNLPSRFSLLNKLNLAQRCYHLNIKHNLTSCDAHEDEAGMPLYVPEISSVAFEQSNE